MASAKSLGRCCSSVSMAALEALAVLAAEAAVEVAASAAAAVLVEAVVEVAVETAVGAAVASAAAASAERRNSAIAINSLRLGETMVGRRGRG